MLRKLVAWWSKNNHEIAVAMDGVTAQRIVTWLTSEAVGGRILAPEAVQLKNAVLSALHDCPPEYR